MRDRLWVPPAVECLDLWQADLRCVIILEIGCLNHNAPLLLMSHVRAGAVVVMFSAALADNSAPAASVVGRELVRCATRAGAGGGSEPRAFFLVDFRDKTVQVRLSLWVRFFCDVSSVKTLIDAEGKHHRSSAMFGTWGRAFR